MASAVDVRPGDIRPTGNPLDLAVDGDGFFVVEVDGETRYTRAGDFQLDDQGRIVLPSGARLQGTSGELVVDVTQGAPAFAPDGTLSVGGATVGRVRLARFDDPSVLTPAGGNTFTAPEGTATDVDSGDVRVVSGFVEASNVNPVREMVQMIEALRTYEASEKAVQAADQILDTLINRVGRVPAQG